MAVSCVDASARVRFLGEVRSALVFERRSVMTPPPGSSSDLADLFAASNGRPIEVNGQIVQLALEIPIVSSCGLTITFLSASPGQALCLKLNGGKVVIAGQAAPGMVLWQDTAPPRVDGRLEIGKRAKGPASLHVWNGWRGKYGETQAWLKNAGMIVTEVAPAEFELRCSDGPGQVDFEALQVRVALNSAGAAR